MCDRGGEFKKEGLCAYLYLFTIDITDISKSCGSVNKKFVRVLIAGSMVFQRDIEWTQSMGYIMYNVY